MLFSIWLLACRLLLRGPADRIGRARVIVAAVTPTALSFLVLAQPADGRRRSPRAALLLGGGVSVLYPTLVALVVDRTPEPERGSRWARSPAPTTSAW